MTIEHPMEIEPIFSGNRVLTIKSQLHTPDYSKESERRRMPNPLEMHANYSRFMITLLNKVNGIQANLLANIPATDIDYIEKKTNIILEKCMLANKVRSFSNTAEITEKKDAVGNKISIAFTQKILIGSFKNMTPADILLQNSNNKSELLNVRAELQKNIDKYAINRKQIQAIDEAIQLFELGNLKSTLKEQDENDDIEPGEYVIYKEDYKSLDKKLDEYNNPLVYHIKISCRPEFDNPFFIEIKNYHSKVVKKPDGTLRVTGPKNRYNVCKMAMTEKEWVSRITRMRRIIDLFEMLNAKKQFQLAEYYENINRENARSNL